MWLRLKPVENQGFQLIFLSKKFSQNCLTRGIWFGIIVKLACGKPRDRAKANLENDTEKKRANIKERLAKIPKSETSRDVKD